MKEAIKHMKFVAKLYGMQADAGRLFLHDQPATATSWQLNCIKKLEEKEGVQITIADLCMFGLTTTGAKAGGARREAGSRTPGQALAIADQQRA